MKYLNIIVEGHTEELFVNTVLADHFQAFDIFLKVRKIQTGWNKLSNKPAKGGLRKYSSFRNDVLRWIESDRKNPVFWYTSMIDLYSFPKGKSSPYKNDIQKISDPYKKVIELEKAIYADIACEKFIPYVQLHEFEALLLVDPDKLELMYPESKSKITLLKNNITHARPEEINESKQTAPSKRIIKFIPEYEHQKAQVGPLIAEDIGLTALRQNCQHFDEWIKKLEKI